MISRTVHKAHSFAEAEEWDIIQNVRMSPEERRSVALDLKRRVYGAAPLDIRESAQSARR